MTGEKNTGRTEAEYRKIPMLSASDLRSFSIDRLKFYKEKILGEKAGEEYNKAMLIGNLVHCLLLEPENFDDKFFMSICSTPPTGLMLTFTESLYKHTVLNMDESGATTVEFSELLDAAYEESGFKITKEAVAKKFQEKHKKTGETPQQYYEQLVQAKSKGLEVACVDDVNIAEKIIQQIKADSFTGSIFEDADGEESFNEQQADGFSLFGLEMKGMLDRIKANHKEKTLHIYDLKVVYDVVNFKREYWLKKQAYIQAYVYWEALKSGILDLGFDYSDYQILPPIFVVVHSGCFYAPLQFKMSLEDLEKAWDGFMENEREYKGVKEIIEDILWCQEKQIWNMSFTDYNNKGVRNF